MLAHQHSPTLSSIPSLNPVLCFLRSLHSCFVLSIRPLAHGSTQILPSLRSSFLQLSALHSLFPCVSIPSPRCLYPTSSSELMLCSDLHSCCSLSSPAPLPASFFVIPPPLCFVPLHWLFHQRQVRKWTAHINDSGRRELGSSCLQAANLRSLPLCIALRRELSESKNESY